MTLELSDEKSNTQGGLTLSANCSPGFAGLATTSKKLRARADRISDADILPAEVGLLVQGRTHYDDIELFRQIPARASVKR